MPEAIYDAIYGRLIGGAIGDALGAPVEGWYWQDICHQFKPFGAGYASGSGHVIDDSSPRHLLCIAIVEKTVG